MDVTFESYAEHRSGDEMQRLLHHGHWIPVLRGYTRRHVAEHFAGWDWNGLVDVCRAAGIIDQRSGSGSPLRCLDSVVRFHFSTATEWAVEWADGSVTYPTTLLPTSDPPEPREAPLF